MSTRPNGHRLRHPNIMVFCLVLGEVPAKEKLFVVDITENISTISRLKSAIKNEKEPDLDHFASNTLTLWKVNIPINNEDRLKILDDVSYGIPEDFYEQQPQIINIIIQVPTTDGLGGTMLPYSADHETFEGISFNDPDISYRSKVVFSLVEDLIKKVILVRTPPYSGKTSLAQLMEYYLTFGEMWKRITDVSWIEWIGQCQQVPTILILDEVQLIYKQGCGIDESKKSSADLFWKTVKGCLQEMTNIYIIMFGAYGYHSANSAGLSTPVEIPPSKYTYDVSKFIEYIQIPTEGHVDLVFHILRYTKEAMERRIRENTLTWKLENMRKYLLKWDTLFDPFDASDQHLVKSGILVVDDGALRFSAPLIMRSFFPAILWESQ
ncbi:2444_t:CDS:2, partial [Dentiscutata heterogama]